MPKSGKGKGKGVKSEPGREPGPNGTSPIPELTLEQATSRDRLATQMRAMGWSPGLCRVAAG